MVLILNCIIIGNLTLDRIVIKDKSFYPVIGGPPAYIGAITSKIGLETYVKSVVGEDYPTEFKQKLSSMNINTSFIDVSCKHTTAFELIYDNKFDRNINLIKLGCRISIESINEILSQKNMDLILISPVINEITVSDLSKVNFGSAFVGADIQGFSRNVSNHSITLKALDKKEIKILNSLGINVLKIAEEELNAILKDLDEEKDAKVIREIFDNIEVIIISKGKKGACVLYKRSIIQVPAWPIDTIINPTGAGDILLGAFSVYYNKTKRIKEAINFASRIATISVKFFDPPEIYSKIIL